MSTVKDGEILRLSVSQVEKFIDCPRQWYFEAVRGRYPEETEQSEDGTKGHALVATYLKTGEKPAGRVKMGKMVTGAIDAGLFPEPAPDLIVERRFSGQEQRDAEGDWIPLDPKLTLLWAGGVPFDGAADLMYYRDGAASVADHKFTSDIWAPWTKKAEDLINTVQMPGYAVVAKKRWPDAQRFRLRHNYISRKGVASDPREAIFTWEQIKERWDFVENTVVPNMKLVAKATVQGDVPVTKDPAVCAKYLGCPHQARCHAFKAFQENKMPLSKEDLSMFGEEPKKPAAKAAVVDPFADLDEMIPEPLKTPEPQVAATNVAQAEKVQNATSLSIQAPAASINPPDAPANDVNTPPPAKAKKGNKAPAIVDVAPGETEEQATKRHETAPATELNQTCGFCGDSNPKDNHADTCPARRVNPKSDPAPRAPQPGALLHTIVELGPKTLAVLEALVAAAQEMSRGYLTQCDSGGLILHPNHRCQATTRLSKPGGWRCENCEKEWGKLSGDR